MTELNSGVIIGNLPGDKDPIDALEAKNFSLIYS